MSKYYNSKFYSKPIEVENIDWEIIVIITDDFWRETIYTWYDIIEKNSQSFYINKCLLWWFIKNIPQDVLIIWFWWWAFAKYLEDHIKIINITWIDIDPVMIEIAKNELKVKTNDFYLDDAKDAIKKIYKDNKKYDLILIDVYWNDWEIPKYFWNKAFFNNVKKVLKNDWVISINFSNYEIWGKNFNKYEKIHSTLINVFWKNYNHLFNWKNDRWNVVWIYNLDKFYKSQDFFENYMEKVSIWEIIYDEKLISNFIVKKYD